MPKRTTRNLIAAMLANAIEFFSLQVAGQRSFKRRFPSRADIDEPHATRALTALLRSCVAVKNRLSSARPGLRAFTPERDPAIVHLWTRVRDLVHTHRSDGRAVLARMREYLANHPRDTSARDTARFTRFVHRTMRRETPWKRGFPKRPTAQVLARFAHSQVVMQVMRMGILLSGLEETDN